MNLPASILNDIASERVNLAKIRTIYAHAKPIGELNAVEYKDLKMLMDNAQVITRNIEMRRAFEENNAHAERQTDSPLMRELEELAFDVLVYANKLGSEFLDFRKSSH